MQKHFYPSHRPEPLHGPISQSEGVKGFFIMNERAKLSSLPPAMADRAIRARTLANNDPKKIEIDDEMLPWVFCNESNCWLSFDGNYSSKSPAEKRQQAFEYKKRSEEIDFRALELLEIQRTWSLIREQVLKRDKYTCQICSGQSTTSLHAHHICKRRDGGTDHMDNLITVCNHCHKKADTVFYNPKWEVPYGR